MILHYRGTLVAPIIAISQESYSLRSATQTAFMSQNLTWALELESLSMLNVLVC